MTAPLAEPEFSTLREARRPAPDAAAPAGADDFAIGCECADPSLQIDGWPGEATAQPLAEFH